MRSLERQIGAIARKVAARVATADRRRPPARRSSTPPTCRTISARRGSSEEVAFRTSRPGVATGVAWTETGGDVLFIEASLLPAGHHNLILTGQLGNVMQESARAAVSHIRAAASELGIVAGLPRQARPARPRAGRRDSEGRPVGRRDDGDGDRLGAAQPDRCARTWR